MRWDRIVLLTCGLGALSLTACSKPEPGPTAPSPEPESEASAPPSEEEDAPEKAESDRPNPAAEESGNKPVQAGNPAQRACVQAGGEIQVVEAPGGQVGICVFPDGSRCESFALLDGKCKQGDCNDEQGQCKEAK